VASESPKRLKPKNFDSTALLTLAKKNGKWTPKNLKNNRFYPKNMKRIHLIISGMVQGIWFRHNTNRVANKLGLKGFVRNMPDGNVEVIAEGPEDKLKELIAFCRKGPAGARVDDVKVEYEEARNEFEGFSIRY